MMELLEVREDVKKLLQGVAGMREQIAALRGDLDDLKRCGLETGRGLSSLAATVGVHGDRLDRLRFWVGAVATAVFTVAAKLLHSVFYGHN